MLVIVRMKGFLLHLGLEGANLQIHFFVHCGFLLLVGLEGGADLHVHSFFAISSLDANYVALESYRHSTHSGFEGHNGFTPQYFCGEREQE